MSLLGKQVNLNVYESDKDANINYEIYAKLGTYGPHRLIFSNKLQQAYRPLNAKKRYISGIEPGTFWLAAEL